MKPSADGPVFPINPKLQGSAPWEMKAEVALQNAHIAQDMAAATQGTLASVLTLLVAAHVVEANVLRSHLAALLTDLKPDEREGAHGHCLQLLLAALGGVAPTTTTGVPN